MSHSIPLSLYIHLPWCVRKCPYCDFNSHAVRETLDERVYIDALVNDLEQELAKTTPRALHSIFIGGGTPSLFSADSIERLLTACRQQLDFADDIEITLEANPGTAEAERFAGYRAAGVNRLSIGVQSFNDRHLASLGRIHDSAEAKRAVAMALQAGFDNFNIDLMYGLPGQQLDQALADIDAALALGASHVSHYQLTIEPNTLFHKQPPVLPQDEQCWQMQQRCQQLLAAAGLEQYEVSAWSRPGCASRHNLNYWRFGDYLGIGAGAHGKLTDDHYGITRRWKKRQPADYLAGIEQDDAVSGENRLGQEDVLFEFLMNALRLKRGVVSELFEQHTGIGINTLKDYCSDVDSDLLQLGAEKICTTARGYDVLNSVLEQLLPRQD